MKNETKNLLTAAAIIAGAAMVGKKGASGVGRSFPGWESEAIARNSRNGAIRLYHNTRALALDDILNAGEFDTRQHHSEGHGHMLFFTVNPESWGSECKVSIDVPVADFKSGLFRFVNTEDVITEQNIPINKYPIRIENVRGLESERIFEILSGDDERLLRYLNYDFFGDILGVREWYMAQL